MRRISVQEVREAFAKTGLNPVRGVWSSDEENCGCGLMVCALAGGLQLGSCSYDSTREAVCEYLGISEAYSHGFTEGFDGDNLHADRNGENLSGFIDGTAAALAIFGEPANV